MQLLQNEINENDDPTTVSQPMPNRLYFPGTSRLLTIPGVIRDRGILLWQRTLERNRLQWRIILLTRYMRDEPFPGPANIPDLRSYYGPDYDRLDLEDWLRVLATANWSCEPMSHNEYLLMRTACMTMMRTMLSEIPGVRYTYPALWYTFENMGDLLDALTTRDYPLNGQMAVLNDFFNNPEWLPTDPQAAPAIIMLERRQASTITRYAFPRSYRVRRASTASRNGRPQFTADVRNLR